MSVLKWIFLAAVILVSAGLLYVVVEEALHCARWAPTGGMTCQFVGKAMMCSPTQECVELKP